MKELNMEEQIVHAKKYGSDLIGHGYKIEAKYIEAVKTWIVSANDIVLVFGLTELEAHRVVKEIYNQKWK